MKYSKEFLENAFKGCINNKIEISNGILCGCFLCCKTFSTDEIIEWIVESDSKETATCPNCTFDSVLSSKYPVSDDVFLNEMHMLNFGE